MSLPAATRAQMRSVELLRRADERRRTGLCLLEGATLLDEALAEGLMPTVVLCTEAVATEHAGLLGRAAEAGALLALVDERHAARISDRENAPGLLAAVPTPEPWSREVPPSGPVLVPALWGIQDPGNVGTLLRSARAFGAAGLLRAPGGADPLGPKALRASSGAALHLASATVETAVDLEDSARADGLTLCAAVAGADGSGRPPERCLLVLGHETRGVPELPAGTVTIAVPQEPCVESLNVAMAGSVIMADWYRRWVAAGATAPESASGTSEASASGASTSAASSPVRRVAAALVVRDGRVLVQTRAGPGRYQGYWEFPGGGVEAGESISECVRRECLEELELDVRPGPVVHREEWTYDDRRVRVDFVRCEAAPDARPRACEGQQLQWAGARDLATLPFLPANAAVLRILARSLEP